MRGHRRMIMEDTRNSLNKSSRTQDSDVTRGLDCDKDRDLYASIEDYRREQEREREDRQAEQRIRARERAAVDIHGAHRRK